MWSSGQFRSLRQPGQRINPTKGPAVKARLVAASAVATGLGIAVLAGPVAAQNSTSGQRVQPVKEAVPAAAGPTGPEASGLEPLAGRVGAIGESAYPSVYAGVRIAAGTLDVYVAPGDDSALLAAIGATDTAHLPFTVIQVPRSYADQLATSEWIVKNQQTLNGQGIAPEWWGPDPASDAVQVAFQQPAAAQLTALQNTVSRLRQGTLAKRALALPQAAAATPGNYQAVAAAALNAEAPSAGDIVAYGSVLSPGVASTGYNDSKPFDGADKIWYTQSNVQWCTSNFSYNSASNANNSVVVTAGHCSDESTGHDFYTCHTKASDGTCNYNVGTVGKVYYSSDDFETIPSSNEGYVWNDSTGTKYSVNGYIIGEAGDYVTTDGATDMATYGIYVEEGGGGTCATYGGHTVCHAIVLESPQPLCAGGDSGGPILERESDGYHIKAVGIILGRGSSGGNYFCYGQQVYWIRDEAGLALRWGN